MPEDRGLEQVYDLAQVSEVGPFASKIGEIAALRKSGPLWARVEYVGAAYYVVIGPDRDVVDPPPPPPAEPRKQEMPSFVRRAAWLAANGDRPSWDHYFLVQAWATSLRADCTRRRHGAVIVKDRRIVASGYNGAPAGKPGCLEGACPRGQLSYDEHPGRSIGGYDDPTSPGYCGSVHAELNALLHANRADTVGATIYITGEPCHGCRKAITAAGIARAVWPSNLDFPDPRPQEWIP